MFLKRADRARQYQLACERELAGSLHTERQFRHLASHPVELVLVGRSEGIEPADLYRNVLLQDERVTGGNGFDLGEGERGVLQILDAAVGNLPAHDLGNQACFYFHA